MSVVKDILIDELKSSIALSSEYAIKIKRAKTKTKANLYHKKLKKNNQIVADLIVALDKLDNPEYDSQDN